MFPRLKPCNAIFPSPAGTVAISPLFQNFSDIFQSPLSMEESQESLLIGRTILAGGTMNTSEIIFIDLKKAIQNIAYEAHPNEGEYSICIVKKIIPSDIDSQSTGRDRRELSEVGWTFLALATGKIRSPQDITNIVPETNWSSGVIPLKTKGKTLAIRKKGDHASGFRMGHANGLIL